VGGGGLRSRWTGDAERAGTDKRGRAVRQCGDPEHQIFRASARIHARNPTITPFLASLPIELRRHPDLLPSLQTDGDDLVSVFVAMFDEARQKGEIDTAASDLDLMVAFMGAAMGIGLFSYGVAAAARPPRLRSSTCWPRLRRRCRSRAIGPPTVQKSKVSIWPTPIGELRCGNA
jgi:hypothetical protein